MKKRKEEKYKNFTLQRALNFCNKINILDVRVKVHDIFDIFITVYFLVGVLPC